MSPFPSSPPPLAITLPVLPLDWSGFCLVCMGRHFSRVQLRDCPCHAAGRRTRLALQGYTSYLIGKCSRRTGCCREICASCPHLPTFSESRAFLRSEGVAIGSALLVAKASTLASAPVVRVMPTGAAPHTRVVTWAHVSALAPPPVMQGELPSRRSNFF